MINLISLCQNAETIGISGHIRPDGDCVGSTCGLWQFLKKVFPDKRIDVRLEKPADIYAFVPGVAEIVTDEAEIVTDKAEPVADGAEPVYDVFFVIDSVPDRIGAAEKYFRRAKTKVNIDHHITNPGGGDLCYIDAAASSASELVYDLIKEADPEGRYMDAALAETIYLGIIQDCGVFQYSNTSPKTLRIAAELIGYGFDFPKLIDETFYEKTNVQNRVLGFALSNSRLCLSDAFIYSIVTRKDMEALHAGDHDFEGVVNQLRYTKGVKAAALLHETDDGSYKVSLRSGGEVDVSRVAACFGGGGHVRAAGCTLTGSGEEIAARLTAEIEKQLKKKVE